MLNQCLTNFWVHLCIGLRSSYFFLVVAVDLVQKFYIDDCVHNLGQNMLDGGKISVKKEK